MTLLQSLARSTATTSLIGFAMSPNIELEAEVAQWESTYKKNALPREIRGGELTTAYFAYAKQAIAEANPGASKLEIDHIFISKHYGEALAQEVKAYLEA